MKSCEYCGEQNERSATQCRGCGAELHVVATAETRTDSLAPKLVESDAIQATFAFADGFHRVDWNSVSRWIEANVGPLQKEEAWNEVALVWVNRLREDLGGQYFLLQSTRTILLCEQPLNTAEWLLAYAGTAADSIREHLGAVAWNGALGKHVVLVFSDDDDYYQYLSYHCPDGEQAASGGVCIHSGYTHIALPWRSAEDAANAVVHELTHDCLSHLSLPLWLKEGVAVTLEKGIGPPPRPLTESEQDSVWSAAINWRPPTMWHELAERHFGFWTEQNIQSFWAGTSFYTPGDPNELSYSLAEVFVKLLSERSDRRAFLAFLQTARHEDAGQTAALDLMGVDLGEIAGTFLSEGNWRPQRKAMIACWEATGWRKSETNTTCGRRPI
jgi:hypothetical protein